MPTTDYDDFLPALKMSGSTQAKSANGDNHHDEVERQERITTKLGLIDITEIQRDGPYPLLFLTSAYSFRTIKEPKNVDSKNSDFALLLRRRLDKDKDLLEIILEIRSSIIRAALREILKQCSYLNLAACPIKIPKPYHALFHYRKEIFAWAESPDRTEEERKHISVLIDFIRVHRPLELVQQKEYHDSKGHVTFGIIAPGASQSMDNIEWQNSRIATAVPADTEFVLRRQSVSELSDDSNTSIASITDSIFSDATGSSISSVVGLISAGERLVALLLNDIDFSVVCREALNRVTPDRFERNLRWLLKLFAIELRKEAESPQQMSAAHFVRYRARNSAHIIRNSFCSLEKPQADNRLDLGVEVSAQEQVDAEPDGSESDSESDYEDPTDLQQLETFIVTSQAFIKLRNDLSTFIYHPNPIGKQTFGKKPDSRTNP